MQNENYCTQQFNNVTVKTCLLLKSKKWNRQRARCELHHSKAGTENNMLNLFPSYRIITTNKRQKAARNIRKLKVFITLN